MAIESIIQPLRPTGNGWRRAPSPPQWVSMGYPAESWFHAGMRLAVISAVEVAWDKDGIDRGPEYHVSISKQTPDWRAARCTSDEARWVLEQLGLAGAEEDNHVARGVVRNFWRTVAEPMIGLECACKADEPAIVEDKGDYVWRP